MIATGEKQNKNNKNERNEKRRNNTYNRNVNKQQRQTHCETFKHSKVLQRKRINKNQIKLKKNEREKVNIFNIIVRKYDFR